MQRRYGFESKEGDSTNYVEQYEKALEREWAKGKLTVEELEKKKNYLHEHLRGAEFCKTTGLINLLRLSLSPPSVANQYKRNSGNNNNGTYEVLLCGATDHYGSDSGDKGWGCGWRNIQMMCSFLLHFDDYKKALFGGCGYVPTVVGKEITIKYELNCFSVLQEWLENAWAKGFDTQGASQLGGAISFTKKLIGASECAALLRSFGARAQIVDFYSAKNDKAPPKEQQTMITGYFGQSEHWTGNKNFQKRPKYSPFKPNKDLVQWVWDYFTARRNCKFVSPLYLQHEGT